MRLPAHLPTWSGPAEHGQVEPQLGRVRLRVAAELGRCGPRQTVPDVHCSPRFPAGFPSIRHTCGTLRQVGVPAP